MDLSHIIPSNIHELSSDEIESIISKIFTPEMWSRWGRFDKERYKFFFRMYIHNNDIRQAYSLEDFLKEKREQFMMYPRNEYTFDGKHISRVRIKKKRKIRFEDAIANYVRTYHLRLCLFELFEIIMDISEVNAENVDYLTFEELRSVVRQLFTENEWEHSSELNKTRYALLFSAYIKFEGFRQYYTLEQFVKGDTLKFTLPIPDRFSLPTHRDIGRPFYGPRRQPEATITSQDIRRDERGDVAEETASTIETRGRDGQSEEREGRTQENIDNGGERQHVPLPRAESIPQNIATGSHQSAQMIYGTNIQEYRHRTPIPVAQIETLYPFSRRDNVEYASHIDITGRPPAGAPNYPAYDDRLITRTKRGYRYASPHPLRREQQIGNYEGSGPMRNLTRSETYGWQRQRSPRSTRD
ncbi:hypothetical protein GWI33_016830 [Rhynchophorus ferrugineus]|uniref:Uncharacterized protein n=1 Tax=Rhynchophorus ferrugineus TaxID=354439 RepID=A0A834I2Z1_RHYFE|nr:hypothetical protein GWI33_016830 [Rhynchophorus ferrugineus]